MTAHFVNLLEELHRRSLRMASLVEDIVYEACESVFEPDESLAKRILARDREVDSEEVEVEREVIRLMALYQPVGSDLRLLCTTLKVNNDLERVSDCAVNIAERASHLELQAVSNENGRIREMCPLVRRILRNAVHAYSMEDAETARQVLRDDQHVDELYAQIVRDVISDASSEPESMSAYLDLLNVAKNLERIADHATNVAEDVVFMSTGAIIRHESTDSPAPTDRD